MKRQVILEIVLFLCILSSAIKVSAQLRERRNSPQPSEITVTLKMEWDVSELGKPIPASYVTKVPNGTALINIVNKAAGEGKNGPFNKYESVYYSGMGYHITALSGTKQNATGQGKSWLILDEQTGGYAPCGVSTYVPGDGSTTIFNFTTYSSHLNEAGSGYCKVVPSPGQVPPSPITVTIALDWNVMSVGKPVPAAYTTQVTNATFLIDVMNKAADENAKGPFNKYASTYYGGLGHFITAMNGVKQDPSTNTYWMIYDNQTGKLISMDSYQPKEGSVTVFRLEKVASHGPTKGRPTETKSSGHKFVELGLVFMCLLSTIESLLIL